MRVLFREVGILANESRELWEVSSEGGLVEGVGQVEVEVRRRTLLHSP